MYNRLSIFLVGAILPWLMVACSDSNDPEVPPSVADVELADNVLVFTDQQIPNFYLQQAIDEGEEDPTARLRGDIMGRAIVIVKLSGKASHVGVDISVSPPKYIPYDATVPQTGVWIAEHPDTRNRQLQTDDTGWWTMYIVKDAEADLEFSFVYEKEGWPTTKTNINTIADEDDTDFGIQLIDGPYYQYSMIPFIEAMLRSNGYPNFFFDTAMVVTVGKSWGSLHDERLPHGDPGAVATVSPGPDNYIGPVYFNRQVIPDLNQPDVSVDGGVAWLNMASNRVYHVSAEKDGVNYSTVRFDVADTDQDAGIKLYIASPPDSVQGDNDSPPGEP